MGFLFLFLIAESLCIQEVIVTHVLKLYIMTPWGGRLVGSVLSVQRGACFSFSCCGSPCLCSPHPMCQINKPLKKNKNKNSKRGIAPMCKCLSNLCLYHICYYPIGQTDHMAKSRVSVDGDYTRVWI